MAEEGVRLARCKSCECTRFGPNRWRPNLCRFCYHPNSDHQCLAPMQSTNGWSFAIVEGPFRPSEMRQMIVDSKFQGKEVIFRAPKESSWQPLEAHFSDVSKSFLPVVGKSCRPPDGRSVIEEMEKHLDESPCLYIDDEGVEQGPFPWSQVFEWTAAGYFQADRLVRSEGNDTHVPLQDLISFIETKDSKKIGEFSSRVDYATKEVFWVNENTGEKTYTAPKGKATVLPEVGGEETKPAVEEEKAEGEPPKCAWEAVLDPDSGKTFYWNSETEVSTWDCPPELKDGALETKSRQPIRLKGAVPPRPKNIVKSIPVKSSARIDNPMRSGYKRSGLKTNPLAKMKRQTKATAKATPKKVKPKGKAKGKRQQILGESVDVASFKRKKETVKKETSETAVILKALNKADVFAHLADREKSAIADAMTARTVSRGEDIIKQGDRGDFFYIVKTGSFDIYVGDAKVAEVGAGAHFGELALMFNCPRAATVKASIGSVVWALDRATFRGTLAVQSTDTLNARKAALHKVHLLKELSPQQLAKIVVAISEESFEDGETIIRRGDPGEEFYMVKKGRVRCTDIGADVNDVFLGEGDYFGERALLRNEPRAATVLADGQTTVLVLSKNDFSALLGDLSEVLNKNHCERILRSIPSLAKLTADQIRKLVGVGSFQTFAPGEKLFSEQDPSNGLFVLCDGEIFLGADAVGAGVFFGEDVFDSARAAETRGVNAVGKTTAECFVLTLEAFESSLGSISSLLGSSTDAEAVTSSGAATAGATASGGRERPNMSREDLEELAVLGTGTFGTVKLVRHKATRITYAMKMLQKSRVVDFKQELNVVREKQVLWAVDHPFVLKLVTTFKDENYLMMLLELVQGGELYSVLCREEVLGTAAAKFYAACTLCGLAALHSHEYAYRDLKPENLMLDTEGYLKIVDFGFAKRVEPGERTWTLCGTPEYLAPEIVAGKGYDKSVDWWALGILIFEMLCGYSPFSDADDNQMVIFKNVLKAPLEFPPEIRDSSAKDLIGKLVCRDTTKRFGALKNGSKDILDHPWFQDINFEALVAKKLDAPWKPAIKSDTDTGCFDTELFESEPDDFVPYVDDGRNWDADF